MTTKTSPLEEQQLQDERLSVLVTLAVQSPAHRDEEHPSAEELAAFSEGQLSSTDRERVLAHLDACSDCYNEWLAVTHVLAAVPDPRPQAEEPRPSPMPISSIPHRRRRIFLWSGTGLALAASLALFLLAPWRTDSELPTLIDRAYDPLQTASVPGLRETAARQTLPWEASTPTYSFASDTASEAARAFAAGLWEGRAMLSGDGDHHATRPALLAPSSAQTATPDAWQNTEWADYALLGRWLFLLHAVCRTPQAGSPAFWSQQQAVAEVLRDQLTQRPATDPQARPVATVVHDLGAILHEPESGARHRRCAQIERDYLRLNALLTRTVSP
ncbi:MAG TPA: zf-HC2 domain-containing protein [Candidatus Competibacter sp.]|nr:zf-HC2 domain-containing protein [Candidatus Competibacter sp.]